MANFPIPPTFSLPFVKDESGKEAISPVWLQWFLDVAQVFTALGASSTGVDHNALNGLQGGSAAQYFHLTSAQHTAASALPVAAGQIPFGTGTALESEAALSYAKATDTLSAVNVVQTKGTLTTAVFQKTSGAGIKVDPAAETYPWQDLLGQIDVRGVGANDPAWNIFRNGIRAYQFGLNDECWVFFHLGHDYVAGTDIYIHSHWAHTSAGVASGSVTWSFESTYAKGHNQAAFPATKTTTVTQTASTTQYQHMIAETPISSAGGSATLLDSAAFEPDGLLLVRISLTANSMTGTPDPFLFLADCHYQSTGIGTKQKAPNFYV